EAGGHNTLARADGGRATPCDNGSVHPECQAVLLCRGDCGDVVQPGRDAALSEVLPYTSPGGDGSVFFQGEAVEVTGPDRSDVLEPCWRGALAVVVRPAAPGDDRTVRPQGEVVKLRGRNSRHVGQTGRDLATSLVEERRTDAAPSDNVASAGAVRRNRDEQRD